MEQNSRLSPTGKTRLRWAVIALALAALLVFAGAALAQEGQPQADAAPAAKPAPGLVVIHVAADGPAATAGVARGDILLAVDDDPVNTFPELSHVILSHDPGDVVVIKLTHGDEERSLSVTLGDNNGVAELGVMAVGDMAAEGRMDRHSRRGWGMPGQGRGWMPDMPDMPEMHGMPFGRGQGMFQMAAEGALIVETAEEGPAAAAGLQAGDVITGLNAATVAGPDELIALLGDHKPGDVVTVHYSRDDSSATAEVALGAHPDDAEKAYLGVQIAPTGPAVEMEMMPFMPGQGMMNGVVLADVTADGPAAAAGLEAGDWISAVNGEAISDPQALVDAVKAAKPGDEMVLTVQGDDDDEARDVTVTLGENDEGGALLGVQIGGGMRIQRGPGGMNFDFHNFRGQGGERGEGMPFFFFGRPGQEDGGRFEFRMPQFRFQTPDTDKGDDAGAPARPGYVTEGA